MNPAKRVALGLLNKGTRLAADRLPLHRWLDAPTWVSLAYRLLLRRRADPEGRAHFLALLEAKGVFPSYLFESLPHSPEYRKLQSPLHYVRQLLVASLPAAEVIVDLGGSSVQGEEGALYLMGYRHPWQRMLIVDLPPAERHPEWRKGAPEPRSVRTPCGPVEYRYGSLGDPALFCESGFADLVWSGNSLEHITPEEADVMLATVRRILRPGGAFCLDTPNRAITRLISPGAYLHPEHRVEYEHAELARRLAAHGFEILEARGVLDCSAVRAGRPFTLETQMEAADFAPAPESGFLLFYRCRTPPAQNG